HREPGVEVPIGRVGEVADEHGEREVERDLDEVLHGVSTWARGASRNASEKQSSGESPWATKAGATASTIVTDRHAYTWCWDRSGKSSRIASCTSPVRPDHASPGCGSEITGTKVKFAWSRAHPRTSSPA